MYVLCKVYHTAAVVVPPNDFFFLVSRKKTANPSVLLSSSNDPSDPAQLQRDQSRLGCTVRVPEQWKLQNRAKVGGSVAQIDVENTAIPRRDGGFLFSWTRL